MASAKVKTIHFIYYIHYGSSMCCNTDFSVWPIEDTMDLAGYKYARAHGTFDVKKVTCKRCLKQSLYKEALEKAKNPLFYWKENL